MVRYILAMSIFFKLSVIVSLLLATIVLKAQVRPACEILLDKACQCMTTKDLKNLDGVALEMVGDSCMESAFWGHITGLMKEFNVEEQDSLFKIAKKIGQQLTIQCPSYQYYASRVARGDLKIRAGDRELQTGILLSFNERASPPYFTVLDTNGIQQQFYWLREFDGSARFFTGIEPFNKTEFNIIWQTIELYDAPSKSYKSYSEIILMEEVKILTTDDMIRLYPNSKQRNLQKNKRRKEKK